MHVLDVVKGVSLRHKETGDHGDVLRVTDGQVELDRWSATTHEWRSLDSVLLEFETLVQSDGLPVLAVEQLAGNAPGFVRDVRVVVLELHPAFVDDDESLTLRATETGLPVLEAYLAAVAAGESWLNRESGGNAALRYAPLARQPGGTVSLLTETYSKRYPSHWYAVVAANDAERGPWLTVTIRNEQLANQLFNAIAVGDVQLASE